MSGHHGCRFRHPELRRHDLVRGVVLGLYADIQGVTDPAQRRQIVLGYLTALASLNGTQFARVRYTGSTSTTDTSRTVANGEWGSVTAVNGNQITVSWDAGGNSTIPAGQCVRWVATITDGLNFNLNRNLFWCVVSITRNGVDVTSSFDVTNADGTISHLNPLEWGPIQHFPVLDPDPAGSISVVRTRPDGSQQIVTYNDNIAARVPWLVRTAIRDRTGVVA